MTQRGEEIADNPCKTFGTTREQAVSEAMDEENDRSGYMHELGNCAIYSFRLACDIYKMVRQEYWIEAEELVCNFIADYGLIIFQTLRDYLGEKAWNAVP